MNKIQECIEIDLSFKEKYLLVLGKNYENILFIEIFEMSSSF